jgi:hypothetical protein
MKHHQLATFAGAVLLSVACGQKNNPKPSDKPADKPTATPTTKPADKPAPVAATPASAPAAPLCRALVNGISGSQEAVFDVKIGATSTVEVGEGAHIMVDNGQVFAVQIAQFEATQKFKVGSMSRNWEDLVVTTLPGGSAKTVTKNEPKILTPNEAEGFVHEYSARLYLETFSTIGPYLSVSISENGFTGVEGERGYRRERFATLKMPEGTFTSQEVIEREASAQIAAYLKEINKDRVQKPENIDEMPYLDMPDNSEGWAYSFQQKTGKPDISDKKPTSFGLWAQNWLPDCCSQSPEIAMLSELQIQLLTVPSTLKPFLALSADNKWIEAPNGCGAVSLEGGALKVRAGKDGAVQDLGKQSAVYGVYWLDEKSTFAVSQLPKKIPKTALAEEPSPK